MWTSGARLGHEMEGRVKDTEIPAYRWDELPMEDDTKETATLARQPHKATPNSEVDQYRTRSSIQTDGAKQLKIVFPNVEDKIQKSTSE
jgi:hypothetical protein